MAGRDDIMNMQGMSARKPERKLFRLGELDNYEVADDDPDVRGWEVLDQNGEKIGEIEDLIVDPELLKVRYLDIATIDELDPGDAERHLLIPIGAARLDEDDDEVIINGLNRDTLKEYPVYGGGPVTLDYEHSLRESISGRLTGKSQAPTAEGETYNSDLYDEEHFYSPRRNPMLPDKKPHVVRRG